MLWLGDIRGTHGGTCQRFGVGLGIGAVAEMLDKPKSVGSAVATEDWFVFEGDVDILVSKEVHLCGCEDGCAV